MSEVQAIVPEKSLNEDENSSQTSGSVLGSGEENNESIPENNESIAENKEKKANPRHRKKNKFNLIREQMEFYFSDSNLLKDRFLMRLIRSEYYVPLEIFLKFNKIKKLATSVEDIAKSLVKSKILVVNEDKTRVKRKHRLPEFKNPVMQEKIDKCTLYVEGIPPHANHDWLKKVFTQFSGGGKVQYVSLPKYRKTNKIKEFAFIEFAKEESVVKCLKKIEEFGGVLLSRDEIDPSELKTVTSFIKEHREDHKATRKERGCCVSPIDDDDTDTEQEETTKESSTSSSSDEEDEIQLPEKKKIKLIESTNEDTSNCQLSTTTENEEDNMDGNEKSKKKKNRKRTKKQKTKSKKLQLSCTEVEQPNGTIKTLNMDTDVRELKVLPKKDWKRLRNKYLNLQREKIAELKRKARLVKQQEKVNSQDKKVNLSKNVAGPSTCDARTRPIEFNKESPMNFYCSVNDEVPEKRKRLNSNSETENVEISQNPPSFQFETGIILKIDLHESCTDVKGFKADIKQYEGVKYVDIKEGSIQAHVRVDTPEKCNELAAKLESTEMKCTILSGNDESQYWEKIMQDREQKLNKNIPKEENITHRKRGRDKINKIIATHIRFNDDDDDD